ncbi:hypothetical protein MNBD_NITROSPINAE03-54 [hydrothermal vent metagenome]|uniref:Uncharacterized protein n=1 Tax=hydrothermal vent metagenome TaxID=652676 RepID=A0A3B1CB90_9ZZZZ
MAVDIHNNACKKRDLKLAASAATRGRKMYKFWFVLMLARFAGGVNMPVMRIMR